MADGTAGKKILADIRWFVDFEAHPFV
jgi:hypothetical protein